MKRLLIIAGLSFALLLPLIGLRLVDSDTGLQLIGDLPGLAGAVIAIVATVLLWQSRPKGISGPAISDLIKRAVGIVSIVMAALLSLLPIAEALQLHRKKQRTKSSDTIPKINSKAVGILLAIAAVIFPLLPFADRYLMEIATLIFIYMLLGWGLNITIGLTGLLDLGYIAFYALGAYAYALLAINFELGFWTALPLSMLVGMAASLIVGIPTLRLRGDYFAIATLGFAEIVRLILINWQSLTGGPNGISRVPRPTWLGEALPPAQRVLLLYYIALGLALTALLFVRWLRRRGMGRALEAIREDEIAASAVGIGVAKLKLAAYMISAALGSAAGALFAAKQGFISPESFTFAETAVLLAIVVLGGAGSALGVAVAAALLVGVPEAFRELQDYRMLAFGIGLVLLMIWRPGGLFAIRKPQVKL